MQIRNLTHNNFHQVAVPVGAWIPKYCPSNNTGLAGGGVFTGNAHREVITVPFLRPYDRLIRHYSLRITAQPKAGDIDDYAVNGYEYLMVMPSGKLLGSHSLLAALPHRSVKAATRKKLPTRRKTH